MPKSEVIIKTEAFVRNALAKEGSGHDWWHVYRVWQMAKIIGVKEKANMFVIETAALLHDIADWKSHNGDSFVGYKAARNWLDQFKLDVVDLEHICKIVAEISFKSIRVKSTMLTMEGKIVQDADRLDAIGAIGIARAFTYGGNRGLLIYDPDNSSNYRSVISPESNGHSTSIKHFYEKLLHLKDRMNTEYARKLAIERHKFMEKFITRFFDEWDGTR